MVKKIVFTKILVGAILIAFSAIIVKIKANFVYIGIFAIASAFGGIIFKIGWDEIIQFKKAMKNLNKNSLQILVGRHHGVPFVASGDLGEQAIHHLCELKILESIVFPKRLNYCYYLTNLGRCLLDKELKISLYPTIFCDMFLFRYWKDYNEFAQKKIKFERSHKISWERCWDIFIEHLKAKGLQANDDNAITIFENYRTGKNFSTIIKEFIDPWELDVKKEKKFKSFRLYV